MENIKNRYFNYEESKLSSFEDYINAVNSAECDASGKLKPSVKLVDKSDNSSSILFVGGVIQKDVPNVLLVTSFFDKDFPGSGCVEFSFKNGERFVNIQRTLFQDDIDLPFVNYQGFTLDESGIPNQISESNVMNMFYQSNDLINEIYKEVGMQESFNQSLSDLCQN